MTKPPPTPSAAKRRRDDKAARIPKPETTAAPWMIEAAKRIEEAEQVVEAADAKRSRSARAKPKPETPEPSPAIVLFAPVSPFADPVELPSREPSPEAEADERAARRVGRPSTYDPAMCDDVIAFGKAGWELVEMAVAFGVARQTLYKWADQHPEFGDALARAREEAETYNVKHLRRDMKLPAKETNVSARLSYMARRFGKEWREPKPVEHSGPDGGPIEMTSPDLTALTDEQLDALDAINGAMARKPSSTH